MSKITYTDKVTLNENPNVEDVNKVRADDLNEIKNVVNANDDNVGDLADLKTTDVSSVVNAVNEIVGQNNITTGSNAVKTGRKVDGKDEYTQKINVGQGPNNGSTEYNYKTDDKIITNYYVLGISNNNEIIYVPNSSASGQYFNAFFTGNKLQLASNIDRTRFTCYLYISYINK